MTINKIMVYEKLYKAYKKVVEDEKSSKITED